MNFKLRHYRHDEQGQCAEPVMLEYDDVLDRLCGHTDNEWQSAQPRVIEVNDDGSVTFREGHPGGAGKIIGILNGLVASGDFPDWRNVLPREETPRMDINPKYVALFGTLIPGSTCARLTLWISPFNGTVSHGTPTPPAVIKVDGREDFTGLVMGMVPLSVDWPTGLFDLLRPKV